MKTTLKGGGWCQSRFGRWRATGIAICRGGEGRKPRWNELEGKLSGEKREDALYRTWERTCYLLRFFVPFYAE